MAEEEIEIEISPSGKVTARTMGSRDHAAWTSPTCWPASSAREVSRELTNEYYEADDRSSDTTEVKQHR